MEEVIRKIISIEHAAQDILNEAEQDIVNRKNELDTNLQKLHERLIWEAHEKVAQLRTTELENAHSQADVIIDSCTDKLNAIGKIFDDKGEAWSDELVKAVLKR